MVIPCKYIKPSGLFDFNQRTDFNDNHVFVFNGEHQIFIDTNGMVKFEINNPPVLWQPSDSFIIVGNISKRGVINYNGIEVIPQRYSFIRDFSENLFAVQFQNSKWGYINSNNDLVIDTLFDSALSFKDGIAPIAIGGKWGLINKKGEIVILPKYDKINEYSEGLAKVTLADKFGYINQTGDLVIPIKFDDFLYGLEPGSNFISGRALIKVNYKYGWIDQSGAIVIQPKYNNAYDFRNGFARVSNEMPLDGDVEKFSYINIHGDLIYDKSN
jgi:hypothetical protein